MSISNNTETITNNNEIIESIKSKIQKYTPSSGGSSGAVALFKNLKQLEAYVPEDSTQLAVVYDYFLRNVEVGDTFKFVHAADTVVMDTAVTATNRATFRSEPVDDNGNTVTGMINVTATQAYIRINSEGGSSSYALYVRWSSSDGITYTRTGTTTPNPLNNLQALPYEFTWISTTGDAAIPAKFMQVETGNFQGVFDYRENSTTPICYALYKALNVTPKTSSISYTVDTNYVNPNEYKKVLFNLFGKRNLGCTLFSVDGVEYINTGHFAIDGTNGFRLQRTGNYNGDHPYYYKIVDKELGTYEAIGIDQAIKIGSFDYYSSTLFSKLDWVLPITYNIRSDSFADYAETDFVYPSGTSSGATYLTNSNLNYGWLYKTGWCPVVSQLSESSSDMFGSSFFGSKGLYEGTMQDTEVLPLKELTKRIKVHSAVAELEYRYDLKNLFYKENDIEKIVFPKMKMHYLTSDTETILETGSYMIQYNENLKYVDMSLVDMSYAETMQYAFAYNPKLEYVQFPATGGGNGSLGIHLFYAFRDCPSLTDEGLNEIMRFLADAGNLSTSSTTLKELGFTEEQATRARSLSNWSRLSAKGWTSGY